jgi:hypothetical protein
LRICAPPIPRTSSAAAPTGTDSGQYRLSLPANAQTHGAARTPNTRRFVDVRDPKHLAHYELSLHGARTLTQVLRQNGQPVPAGLGRRGQPTELDLTAVNRFFVDLVAHARHTGRAHLYRWRHALDTEIWLHNHGVRGVHPHGDGLWIEDNATISFLLHLDHDDPSPINPTPPPPPSALLAGYRRARTGVPADAALVITPNDQREQQLHHQLANAPVPLTVAATTHTRLHSAASPADAIWTIPAAPGALLPLIQIPAASRSHQKPAKTPDCPDGRAPG